MIRAIIFDLDETLLNRTETVKHFLMDQHRRYPAIQVRVLEHRYVSRFLELDNHGYTKKDVVYPQLVEEFAIEMDWHQLLTDFDNRREWPRLVLFPRVEEYLQQKHQEGYKLGIITNGTTNAQLSKIEKTGLDKLVDTYLISEKEQIRKPEPEIFLRAAKRLDVATTECIFIGDNPRADVTGAQQVGMKTIWFQGHLAWPEDLDNRPDQVVTEFEAMFSIDLERL
ncbi:MAG: HAD-IIIA family hydrolase [Chloroflexota bacterium]